MAQYRTTKKMPSPRKRLPRTAKKSPINNSFRVLESKCAQNRSNEDVYEFTYDPKEEPAPPQKKKRVVTKKRPAKAKCVTFKNYYDQNLSKTLTTLKDVLAKKATKISEAQTQPDTELKTGPIAAPMKRPNKQKLPLLQPNQASTPQRITTRAFLKTVESAPQKQVVPPTLTGDAIKSTTDHNFSIPIEDIAADLDSTPLHEINYSPVHNPHGNTSDISPVVTNSSAPSKDPLNIRGELSFFDDDPIASSSMNVSARHPHPSPWRVEFNQLPIKWHVNSYVKPNMTPAVECSFVNFTEGQNKHVYTNMLPERDDVLPEIVQDEQPNMVQSSIISFFKEVVENSAKKNKRERSKTPATSAIFDDITSATSKPAKILSTPRKSIEKSTLVSENTSNDDSNEKENSRNTQKRKSESDENVPPKSARKKKHGSKENTFFGFDDSEDQENVSPKEKELTKVRALRSKARAVLKEINEQTGPTRALIPRTAKTRANLNVVNKLHEGPTPAEKAPDIVDKYIDKPEVTTFTKAALDNDASDEDSQSVHLFEDIEICHHFKPQRKSYGRAKKVTFRQHSSDSDSEVLKEKDGSASEEDNMFDLTFEMPAEERKTKRKAGKKMTKKQKLNKKEAAEAEAWAAGFNLMCEDVDEFPLLVE